MVVHDGSTNYPHRHTLGFQAVILELKSNEDTLVVMIANRYLALEISKAPSVLSQYILNESVSL